MTERLNWNSPLKAGWWRGTTLWWRLLLVISLLTGLYIYVVIIHNDITSGPLAGAIALFLVPLAICCWRAALAHLAKHHDDGKAEVNIGKAFSLFMLVVSVTIFAHLGHLPPPFVAAGAMLSTLLLALTVKNLIVLALLEKTA